MLVYHATVIAYEVAAHKVRCRSEWIAAKEEDEALERAVFKAVKYYPPSKGFERHSAVVSVVRPPGEGKNALMEVPSYRLYRE